MLLSDGGPNNENPGVSLLGRIVKNLTRISRKDLQNAINNKLNAHAD